MLLLPGHARPLDEGERGIPCTLLEGEVTSEEDALGVVATCVVVAVLHCPLEQGSHSACDVGVVWPVDAAHHFTLTLHGSVHLPLRCLVLRR